MHKKQTVILFIFLYIFTYLAWLQIAFSNSPILYARDQCETLDTWTFGSGFSASISDDTYWQGSGSLHVTGTLIESGFSSSNLTSLPIGDKCLSFWFYIYSDGDMNTTAFLGLTNATDFYDTYGSTHFSVVINNAYDVIGCVAHVSGTGTWELDTVSGILYNEWVFIELVSHYSGEETVITVYSNWIAIASVTESSSVFNTTTFNFQGFTADQLGFGDMYIDDIQITDYRYYPSINLTASPKESGTPIDFTWIYYNLTVTEYTPWTMGLENTFYYRVVAWSGVVYNGTDYTFDHYLVNDSSVVTDRDYLFQITGDTSIKAIYYSAAPPVTYLLTINAIDTQTGSPITPKMRISGGDYLCPVSIDLPLGVYEISPLDLTFNTSHTYIFKNWTDGNTDNPRYLNFTGDTSLTANYLLTENWQLYMPIGSLLWIIGLVAMIYAPMHITMKCKEHRYREGFVVGLAIMSLGFGLFLTLWSGL